MNAKLLARRMDTDFATDVMRSQSFLQVERRPKEDEEETSFQASFISRLERVSPHLPSFNQIASFWHLGSVGSDLLLPGLNENIN